MSDVANDHPLIAWLNRIAAKIADLCLIVACLILLWLVGLTCVDVIGRYFFRSPVVGATELVQIISSAFEGSLILTLSRPPTTIGLI